MLSQDAHLPLPLINGRESVVPLPGHIINLVLQSVTVTAGLAKLLPQILRSHARIGVVTQERTATAGTRI